MKKALVIGAGVGGLASALRLRSKGYDVTVFEANAYPGGKLHAFEMNGYRFDAGPSLFTRPDLVTELFELFGLKPEDHFRYKQKGTICNYFWEDGTRFSAPADPGSFAEAAHQEFGTSVDGLITYLKRNQRKYDLTGSTFLEHSLHKTKTWLTNDVARALLRLNQLDVFETLDEVNRKCIDHPKLVQLFNRYATYNGSSPYETPGILSMIPHLEMALGTYFPEGGMHAITQSLYGLALDQGVNFRFNASVSRILHKGSKATGIVLGDEEISADLIVSNVDVFTAYRHLLADLPQPEKTLKQERSSSAVIFYWGIKKQFPELDLHNILFADDYQTEFDCLFRTKEMHDDPTVYINITSKEQPDAPPGCENWFVMVNAPANIGQDWAAITQLAREKTIAKVNRILGTNLESLIEVEDVLDPILIESRTGSHQGSLYGTASNSRFAAFLRHPNFSRHLNNLFFTGGSVHPGGGIPLCLLSARIAANLIPEAS